MSGMQWWGSGRRTDKPTAIVVGVGNLLLSSVLVMMMIGGPWFFDATTRQQETAAWESAVPIFGGRLLGRTGVVPPPGHDADRVETSPRCFSHPPRWF
ncbi:hypothetical protein ACFWBH_22355 [Streptomyces sp. NPDC059999]|uniref:hypothetical protein n=1 Tax=Streptomyces sp. NPDC059999 TaxID=3347030 RepID=UPI00369BFB7F